MDGFSGRREHASVLKYERIMTALAVKLKLILLATNHPSNAELCKQLQPYENRQSGIQTRQKMNNTRSPFPEMTNKSNTAISNSRAVATPGVS